MILGILIVAILKNCLTAIVTYVVIILCAVCVLTHRITANITHMILVFVCFGVNERFSADIAKIVKILILTVSEFLTAVVAIVIGIFSIANLFYVCAITADSGIFTFVTDMIHGSSVYALGQNLSASVVTYVITVSISIGTSAHSFCSAVVTYVIGILVVAIELSNGYVTDFHIIAFSDIIKTVQNEIESTTAVKGNISRVHKLIFAAGHSIERHRSVQCFGAFLSGSHINTVNNDLKILLSANNVSLGQIIQRALIVRSAIISCVRQLRIITVYSPSLT